MCAEQRRFPRIKVFLETTYYSDAMTSSEQRGEDRRYLSGTILNSSRYGLGLEVRCSHAPSERLWFTGIERDGRPIPGLVQWVDTAQQGLYNIGVRLFHSLP